MTSDILGFHHVGILTRDLDGLERRYTSFGFTLSPRSRHALSRGPGEPEVLGCTANLCALFGDSYIELLGIVDESAPDPWHTREMADGFRLLNLGTADTAATDARLTAAGLRTSGVLNLRREVDTEEGPRTVRASAVHLDPALTPELNLGVAQHLTREYVHQPRYLRHPNGASGIRSVLIVAEDAELPAILARHALITGGAPYREGALTVIEMSSGRMEFVALSDTDAVLPDEPVVRTSHAAAITIRVADLTAARAMVETSGAATRTTGGSGFYVSADDAYGAGLFFTD